MSEENATNLRRSPFLPSSLQNPAQTHPLFADENVVVYMQLPPHTSEFSCKFDPSARQLSASSLNLPTTADAVAAAVQPVIVARPSQSPVNLSDTTARVQLSTQTVPKTRVDVGIGSTQEAKSTTLLLESGSLYPDISGDSSFQDRHHRRRHHRSPNSEHRIFRSDVHVEDTGRMSPVVRPVSHAPKQMPRSASLTGNVKQVPLTENRSSTSATKTRPQRAGSVQPALGADVRSEQTPKVNQHDRKSHPSSRRASETPTTTGHQPIKDKPSHNEPLNVQVTETSNKAPSSGTRSQSKHHRSGTPESTTTTTAMALQLLKAAGIDTKLVEEALDAGAYTPKPKRDEEALSSAANRTKPTAPRRSRSENLSESPGKRSVSDMKLRTSPVQEPTGPPSIGSAMAPPVIAPSGRRRRASAQPRIGEPVQQPRRQSALEPTESRADKKNFTPSSETVTKTIVRSHSRGSVRSGSILTSQQHDTIHEHGDEHKHHVRRSQSNMRRQDQYESNPIGEHDAPAVRSPREASLTRSSSVPKSSVGGKRQVVQPPADNDRRRRHSSAIQQKSVQKDSKSQQRDSPVSARSRSSSPTTTRSYSRGGDSVEEEDKQSHFVSDDEVETDEEAKAHHEHPLDGDESPLPRLQAAPESTETAQQLTTVLRLLQQHGIISVSRRNSTDTEANVDDEHRSTPRRLTRQISLEKKQNPPSEARHASSSPSDGEDVPLPPRRDSRDDLRSDKSQRVQSDKRRKKTSTSSKISSPHVTGDSREQDPSGKSTKPHHQLMKEGVEWQAHMSTENQMLTQAVQLLEKLVSKKLPPCNPQHAGENGRIISNTSTTLVEQLQQLLAGNSPSEISSAQTRQLSARQNESKHSRTNKAATDESAQNLAPELDASDDEDDPELETNPTKRQQNLKKNAKEQAPRERTARKPPRSESSSGRTLSPSNAAPKVASHSTDVEVKLGKRQTPADADANKQISDPKSTPTDIKLSKDDAYAKRIAELKQEYFDITARNKAARERAMSSRVSAASGHRPTSPAASVSTVDTQQYETVQTTSLPPVSLIHAHCFTDYLSSKLDRELREAEECQKRVRSNPVPAHVKLPLYEMMQRNEEQRKLERHEQSVEKLKTIQPFSFVQQTPPPSERQSSELTTDGQQQPTAPHGTTAVHSHHHGKVADDDQHTLACPRAARVMPPPPPAFRARPVPHDLFNNRAHNQREERRRLDASHERTARMDQMKRESSLPPNMERRGQAYFYGKTHTKNQLEMFSRPKHQPEIHASVPDFGELHRQEEDKIEERKRVAAVRSTIPRPFDLATERRAKEKQQNFEEESKHNKEHPRQSRTTNYRPTQLRRVGSSATSLSATNYPTARQFLAPASILPRETWSTRMRRAHSQKRMLASLRGDVETRMRELTGKEKQILMRLKMHGKLDTANSNLDYQMQLNAKRAERMRQIVHVREQTYEKQLAQMQYNVDELRPFLFERQGQKTPQTQKQLVNKVVTAANTISNALQNAPPSQHLESSRTFDAPMTPQAVGGQQQTSDDAHRRASSRALDDHQKFVESMNFKHGFHGGSSSTSTPLDDGNKNDFPRGRPVEAEHAQFHRSSERQSSSETTTQHRPVTARRYAPHESYGDTDGNDERRRTRTRQTATLQAEQQTSDEENHAGENLNDIDYKSVAGAYRQPSHRMQHSSGSYSRTKQNRRNTFNEDDQNVDNEDGSDTRAMSSRSSRFGYGV